MANLPPITRCFWVWGILAICGCSFIFDEEGESLPLRGEPPTDSLIQLNQKPLVPNVLVKLLFGASAPAYQVWGEESNKIWVALSEAGETLRLYRVTEPRISREYSNIKQVYAVTDHAALVEKSNQPPWGEAQRYLHVVDFEAGPVLSFEVPPKAELQQTRMHPGLAVSNLEGGEYILYLAWPNKKSPAGWSILRRAWKREQWGPWGLDPSGQVLFHSEDTGLLATELATGRTVALPVDAVPITSNGRDVVLFKERRDAKFPNGDTNSRLHAYYVLAGRHQDLGIDLSERGTMEFYSDKRTLLLCDRSGLRSFDIYNPVKPPMILNPDSCFALGPTLGALHFVTEQGYFSLSLNGDGKNDPRMLNVVGLDKQEPLGRRGHLTSCIDEKSLYVAQTTAANTREEGRLLPVDGWFDGKRFMERGIAAGFSESCERIYFLERIGGPSYSGELRMFDLHGDGRPRRLALNVTKWVELPDRQLLAWSNDVFQGVHNRLILLDLKKGEARWVLGNTRFLPDPSRKALGPANYFWLGEQYEFYKPLHPLLLIETLGSGDLFEVHWPPS